MSFLLLVTAVHHDNCKPLSAGRMVTDVSFDNRFKVSSSSLVMLRWREGLLFFRIEIVTVLARRKFAESGGRYLIPDSTDDTIFATGADFGVIANLKPWLCACLSYSLNGLLDMLTTHLSVGSSNRLSERL